MRALHRAAAFVVTACLFLAAASSATAGSIKVQSAPSQDELTGSPVQQPLKVSKVPAGYVVTRVSLASGSLPSGVSIETTHEGSNPALESAVISGTPTEAGKFTAEVQATAESGQCAPECPPEQKVTDTQTFKYDISSGEPTKPAIVPIGSARIVAGVGSHVLAKFRGLLPTGYEAVALSASGLPEGLASKQGGSELDITGVPKAATTNPITITGVFTGAHVTTQTATLKVPVTIGGEAANLLIEPGTAKLPSGQTQTEYSLPIAVSGSWTGEYVLGLVEGQLPPGISLVGDSTSIGHNLVGHAARLEGTPTAAGTWTFVLGAGELGCEPECSAQVIRKYSLTVEPNSPDHVRFRTEAGTLAQGQPVTVDLSGVQLVLFGAGKEHEIHCTTQQLSGTLESSSFLAPVAFALPESTFLGEGIEENGECTLREGSPPKKDGFLGGLVTVTTQPIPAAQPPVLAFQAASLKSKNGVAALELRTNASKLLIGVTFLEADLTCVYQTSKIQGTYAPGELHGEIDGELPLAPRQEEVCPVGLEVFGPLTMTSNGEPVQVFN